MLVRLRASAPVASVFRFARSRSSGSRGLSRSRSSRRRCVSFPRASAKSFSLFCRKKNPPTAETGFARNVRARRSTRASDGGASGDRRETRAFPRCGFVPPPRNFHRTRRVRSLAHSNSRSFLRNPTGRSVAPRITRSARASPSAGVILNPCPERPAAYQTFNGPPPLSFAAPPDTRCPSSPRSRTKSSSGVMV